jgi:hypothetical protein
VVELAEECGIVKLLIATVVVIAIVIAVWFYESRIRHAITGASAPAWPPKGSRSGVLTKDGTVIWKSLGRVGTAEESPDIEGH